MTTSTKPYFLRAMYEWCLDNNQTPHILAWVNEHTRVPGQYVKDGQIVLNIGPVASSNLTIDNDWVHFAARFSGVSHDIWIPVGHVVHIFARESGEGLGFELEEYRPDEQTATAQSELADTDEKAAVQSEPASPKKGLKLVK
ncbi:ClpXP protease specificity-enhancing factor [Neisseria animalis]|uniref:ClpXP protease specificity-enhancing factor n=1 Tax=Neisseria animalis TaxID=492 RepID=A0A5P3MQ30_NEIAN|nr:ClpXP protease specificity-enhancing factor [Neisseria animalis]QEY23687.1 ClpXP protease specificity-enhancing factor [Neisseria animalis]ROW32831.1 ClpXP protease specificity-enhancing factor [Neisseria animalis]VEE09488.1 ClpXP protease specificity-enhancing factor [Neisseria animalis]